MQFQSQKSMGASSVVGALPETSGLRAILMTGSLATAGIVIQIILPRKIIQAAANFPQKLPPIVPIITKGQRWVLLQMGKEILKIRHHAVQLSPHTLRSKYAVHATTE